MKRNCKEIYDFIHERERLCNYYKDCIGCPFMTEDDCLIHLCGSLTSISAKVIQKLQEWSDAHPENFLTFDDYNFLESFVTTKNKSINRGYDNSLFLNFDSIATGRISMSIDADMFKCVEPGKLMTFDELLEWRVDFGNSI